VLDLSEKKKTKKASASKPRKPQSEAAKATQFKPGNTIGMDTRFKPGKKPLNCQYNESYPDSILVYFLTCDKLPTIEGWAIENNVAIRTVYDWLEAPEEYPHLANTYAQAKAIQKAKLIELGLVEAYNATLVKFLLTNNHGMSEKVEQDIKAKTDNTINVNISFFDN
jgi:hypothetical protein